MSSNRSDIERRVARAADAALAQRKFVRAIDVLVGVGWLEPRRVDQWRQGRVDYLEQVTVANVGKISTAMRSFRRWAQARGLQPSETVYVARTRDRRPLRFSKSGDPEIERAYRTHWISPKLSEGKRARMAERHSRPPELVVISSVKDFTCSLCRSQGGGLLIMEDSGPVCMGCADMAHLVFLPSGDAALTRRAKAASRLSAVVVRFSRARGRYERQGILVEEHAPGARRAGVPRRRRAARAPPWARRAAARRRGRRVAEADGWRRLQACSRAVRRSGLGRSRGTRRCEALGAWGARPRVGRLTRRRSSLPSPPPSGTRTLATTSS